MEDQQQGSDISSYLKIIYKRRYQFLAVAAGIIAVVIAAGYLSPRSYEASTTVSIEKNYLKELMKDSAVASSVDDRAQALTVVMMSRSTLLKVMSDLSMDLSRMTEADTEKTVKHFQRSTQIRFDISRSSRRDMDLFTVSYRDRDPRFARDYVTALVRRYIIDSLSAKQEQAVGASKFVMEQMDLYKGKLARTETELAQRQKDQGTQYVARLAALKKKYDELLVQYTERHPEVVRVRAEMESIKNKIQNLPSSETEGAASAKTGPAGTATGPEKKSIADLERDREAYKKIYESFVASLGKSEVSVKVEAQATADTFHVLDPAVLPIQSLGPAQWKIILLGLLAGIAGGAGVVIVLDKMDRTIKSISTLKGLGLPVIGVIPRIENAEVVALRKRKDILVYGAAGVYVAGVAALAAVEFLK